MPRWLRITLSLIVIFFVMIFVGEAVSGVILRAMGPDEGYTPVTMVRIACMVGAVWAGIAVVRAGKRKPEKAEPPAQAEGS